MYVHSIQVCTMHHTMLINHVTYVASCVASYIRNCVISSYSSGYPQAFIRCAFDFRKYSYHPLTLGEMKPPINIDVVPNSA